MLDAQVSVVDDNPDLVKGVIVNDEYVTNQLKLLR